MFHRLQPGPRLRHVLRTAADVVWPPHSFDGGPRPLAAGLSAESWSEVRFLDGAVCDGCGRAFDYARPERCDDCRARPFAFSRARAACVYDDASKGMILQFKHADRSEYAALFARWLGRAAADLLAEADAVAPVPLHRLRLLDRRFNQAAEIARPLARAADLQYLPDALVRARATQPQGHKAFAARRANVERAFVVPDDRRKQVRGRRILLVDDVLTTGATTDACARALLDAGARAVDLAVVARVSSGEDLTI